MTFLSTRLHGVLDYATALTLIVACSLWLFGGVSGDGLLAAWVLLAGGLFYLGYSLVTRYELGLVRVLPMKAHLAVDGLAGVALLVSPWVLGFADAIWWPHVLVGVISIAVPLVTERVSPVETPAPPR